MTGEGPAATVSPRGLGLRGGASETVGNRLIEGESARATDTEQSPISKTSKLLTGHLDAGMRDFMAAILVAGLAGGTRRNRRPKLPLALVRRGPARAETTNQEAPAAATASCRSGPRCFRPEGAKERRARSSSGHRPETTP